MGWFDKNQEVTKLESRILKLEGRLDQVELLASTLKTKYLKALQRMNRQYEAEKEEETEEEEDDTEESNPIFNVKNGFLG